MADAGRAGEIAIAKARLVLVLLLLASPVSTLLREPDAPAGWIGVGMTLLCIAIAWLTLQRARSDRMGRWFPVGATLLDISLVSAYHVLLFTAGDASMVLESRATFALYIFVIIGASLRFDGRLVRVAGAAAALQYVALVAWANAAGYTPSERFYGDASVAGQTEELSILLLATVIGAVIVERARELRLSGIRDPLTTLANRSYFFERLQSALQHAERSHRTLVVAMLDIDHFKQINDAHGHAAGDHVLERAARELKRAMKRDELVARLGGEEFAMLLPGASRAEAHQRLDTMREAMHALRIDLPQGARVGLTISIGFAVAPDEGADGERLLAIADARLLAGKRAGRNRVVAMG